MIDLLKVALSQYGIEEVPGDSDNSVIVNYFSEIGHDWVKNDETAWCSAFVNWCAKIANYEYTGKLNARSWLEIGWEVKHPSPGDLVILWRSSPDSWKGHVGFYISHDDDNVYVLGGNQGNQVKVSAYSRSRLLCYRRLRKLG